VSASSAHDEKPSDEEYPRGHSEHAVLASAGENFPPAHSSQDDSLGRLWNCPAGHSVHEEAPSIATAVPAAHATHVLRPSLSAYFPASHKVHELWLETLALPASQRVHLTAVRVAEKEPVLQGLHVVALVALLVKEPAPQVKQAPFKGCGA